MSYAEIKGEWFKATNPDTHFCVHPNKESPNCDVAQVYKFAANGQREILASIPLKGKPVEELAKDIKKLVTNFGFVPSNPPALAA